ncbi:chromosome segregation protein [Catalinimonas alkaloidigena]|uniref:chromosome segregation protein SMC n=1 Tax=Catalinimonas alkaloidigena TaxID=1075417 RepID=UPI00240569C0|nr:chromosome segregation protein SMC [Catalinimonas alkaloidigena]MDF9799833.1 chromosome segregation protein [Catalinimonas alkaloidigena]
MQLTRLEIKGFKSFADKVIINFDKGITGVVGPNGCGKSNVVDAIRWVLGEQKTRMLRSDKMENIIFNGTKKRKATQMAEVSLTFDNTKNLIPTEYTQVTITRRYYRSGDSEYMLNGVTCRLKDITNLFMDTGIASNSYAIIELKMVDEILNDKDNSRRNLFEEAAGISKFRTRKKETLRKLGDTDADLERVEDLLYEIEKNLKSLEKQAKQAEKYYKTKEEYKNLSVQLAKVTVSSQREKLQNLHKQLEAESDRKLSLNRQLSESDALIEQLKTDLVNKEKLLSSRQKSLNQHVEQIRNYESDKQVKNEKMRLLKDRELQLTEQLERDRYNIDQISESLEGLRWQRSEAAENLEITKDKVAQLKQEYEEYKTKTNALKEEVNQADGALREKQDEVYQIKKTLEIKQMQLSATRQDLEKTSADTSAQQADMSRYDERAAELEDELQTLRDELTEAEQAEQDLQQRMESLAESIEANKEELSKTNRTRDALQNEYNLTKSLVDNLEGFPDAIKFIKKNIEWAKKAPLLSDIISCGEEYRVCIENYLSQYMNYYVVQSRAEALEAINLLSDASKGKANFFILDEFEHFKPAASKTFDHAVSAAEIVEYDPAYQALVQYVLNNAYIVNGDFTIPEDKEASFITKDGRIVQHPFSMAGGSVGLFEGKRIGRAKNMEKLKAQLKELEKEVEAQQQSIQEKQLQLSSLKQSSPKEAIASLQKEISQISQEFVSVKTKKEQMAEMLSSNAQKRVDTEDHIQELHEACAELEPQVAEKEEELIKQESKIKALKERLAEENEILSEKSANFNQENIQFYQQENRVSSISQEISFKEEAYQSSENNIAKNQQALKESEASIKQLLESSDVSEDELLAMYEEKEQIEIGVNEAEKDYYSVRGEIDKNEKATREIRNQRENSDSLVLEIQNQLNSTKLELSGVKERLSVEFELDLDELMKEQVSEEEKANVDPEALREKLTKIKDRLQRIGPINPMAMEAYEEIKERYDFINNEKEDLLQAKESLITTIEEIDTVARATFMEAYEKIKENFVKVFRSLFTEEDDCDLKLTNPDDPLESSIDIIARPKGKRPLTINQLSGGEKTLTATSLLFAIYLLKPAPFCIFDEVDAPLDDANIDKFNNIIKTFSKDSQFIIVTHNKRTMASTDIIYGVTMIEQGVSKVVPVDLREFELAPE